MLTEQDIFRLTGGELYWDPRPKSDALLASEVMRAIKDRKANRARLRLYVINGHYRMIREDSKAKDNPLLTGWLVGIFGADTKKFDIEVALEAHDAKAPQRPAAPSPLLPPH